MAPGAVHNNLQRKLYSWQIFFIVASAVIGGGIFENDAAALQVAGPYGFIVALCITGAIVICVMETLSELVQLFPAQNAIVEYVRTFVDEDAAWVAGIAYWYTYAAIFSIQILAAATFGQYWTSSTSNWKTLEGVVYFTVAPAFICAINFFGVFWYGVIETIAGAIKIVFVIAGSLALYILAQSPHSYAPKDGGPFKRDTPMSAGFGHAKQAKNDAQAILYAVPLIVYSFLGLEAIPVTVMEARPPVNVRWPARTLAWAIFALYLFCVMSEVINVDWRNTSLPAFGVLPTDSSSSWVPGTSQSPLVIAALATDHNALAGFMQAACIFSVLSAANSSLYIASRTLYAMCLGIKWSVQPVKAFRSLTTYVWPSTGAPTGAIVLSLFAFLWIPYLHLVENNTRDVIEIMAVSSSMACVLVWALLCVAYLRYFTWLWICADDLDHGDYKDMRRKNISLLSFAQPMPAIFGLLGCIAVFGFASSTWWNQKPIFASVATAYAALVILFAFYAFLKLIRVARKLFGDIGRESQQTIFWVNLDNDVSCLSSALGGLRKKTRQDIPPEVLTKWDVRLRRFLASLYLRHTATPEEVAMEERVLLGHHDHPSQDHWPEHQVGNNEQTREHIYRGESSRAQSNAHDFPLRPLDLQGDRPYTDLEQYVQQDGHLLVRPNSAHLLPFSTGLARRSPTFPRQGSDE